MNYSYWIRWPFRFAIMVAWLVVIAVILYSPHVLNFFSSEKSITIFTWPLIFDSSVLRDFEKETGIKVYISYYESNQELLNKLQANPDRGYDIIVPSGYAVKQLIKSKIIKPLDKSQTISIYSNILPHLKKLHFDPEGVYSIPYFWTLYGIGFDKRVFTKDVPSSWSDLFDLHAKNYCVGMTGDAREAILLAALYLFGSIDGLEDVEKIAQIKKMLLSQKNKVAVYTDLRLDDVLVSGQAPLVLLTGADAIRSKKINDNIEFIIPKQGTFMNVDSIVLSAHTKKDDLIYQFIKYMYRPEIVAKHSKLFGIYPPIVDAPVINQGLPYLQPGVIEQVLFFKNVLTSQQINNIWIDVLSR